MKFHLSYFTKLLAMISLSSLSPCLVHAASDVSIVGSATSGGTFSGGNPNVFTPTAAAANVQGSAITASLNAGNAVVLNTASAAVGNGDIIAASTILTKIAGSSSQLTLNAVRDLSLGSISSSAGSIPLSLNAGRNITNADVLRTLNGNVTINCGQTFTLGNSLLAGTGQIFLQSGTVESHALTVTASSVQVSAGAAWKQLGTLTGNLNVAGTLSAGPAIGALAVSGTTTLQSTATTIVNIGGTTHSTGYDRIATTGAVNLAGNLQISFFSQYGNNFGDSIINSNSFTFLTGGSITGTFTGLPNNSRVTLPDDLGSMKITYTATAVTLSDWQPIVRDLTWDPGTTEAGTEILSQTNTRSGRHYFRINTQGTDIGAWRSRLTVTSGQADLYFFNGTLPQTLTGYTHRSIQTGSDGLVLRSDQYTAGQTWYLVVSSTAGSQWSIVSGRAWVRDLGGLAWTDSNSNGTYDIGEPALPSGGSTSIPPEGLRFFKTSVPAGAPAWSLWLNGSTRDIAVRKSFVPFHSAASYYDRKQSGQMLVVAPYLTGNTSTYFLSVTGNPGEAVNLDSRIQEVQDMPFNSTVNAVSIPTTPYRVYRVQVPVQQIAWDVAVTPTTGDANVCVRRDNAPAEFDNDAFSEVTGPTSDSITLVPDFLTDATWFITIYGNSPYTFTLKNGPPTITPLSFTDTKLNDQTTRAGWRFYTMTDVPSQLGSLGWELNLANQVPGTEIAIRRNAVPSRWRSRVNGSTGISTPSRVDASGTGGFLQRPGHQADIWYVGIYTPTQALGTFTLTSAPMLPTLQTFNGGVQTFSNQEPGRWKYVRIDVPTGVLGWDVRLTNVTGPTPQMVVRRDQLPNATTTTNTNDWYPQGPSGNVVWPSGYQWAAGSGTAADWTDWANNPGSPPSSAPPRLVMGGGRPLEAGTYYLGIFNNSTNTETSYSIVSRGIGSGQTYPVADLVYAGGSTTISNLAPREARYFKVTIPANTPSWEVTLSPSAGEMLLALRRGTIPDFNASTNGLVGAASGSLQTEMQKSGPERYIMLPPNGQDFVEAGEYYLAAISEGATPSGSTIGTGTSSGTLTSHGSLAITDLGIANAVGITQAITMAGGQTKAYQFTVPAGTASLEVRLDNRVGNPGLNLVSGNRFPSTSGYGIEGGTSSVGRVFNDTIVTIANPTPGIFTLLVEAQVMPSTSNYPDASANLVVIANSPIPLGFDAATSTVTNQSPSAWRYFQVAVPAGVLGWDVRLTNVTGPMPQMVVRRDQLPQSVITSGFYHSYAQFPSKWTAWSSGNSWGSTTDWTGKADASFPRIVMGMGRPLEVGTYYVGVFNNSTTTPTSYNIDSRGIGSGQSYSVSDIAYSGGSSTISNLPPREAKYFKVTIPANTPSWEMTLSPATGDMLLAVRRTTIPDFNASASGEAGSIDYLANKYDYQTKLQKTGPERYVLLPLYQQEHITPGDYFIAVVSEGINSSGNSIGTGTSTGTFTSVGPLQVTDMGTASASGINTTVPLVGGQHKAYQFSVPLGTASLEVRLDNRVGNPTMNLRLPNSPGPYGGIYYGSEGFNFNLSDDAIFTVANPIPGIFNLLVRADYLNALHPDASANLVIIANAPVPLGFDAATSTVANQSPGAWRYFQVTVPAGVLGWDVRLTHISGTTPRMFVSRDDLPNDPGVSYGGSWNGYVYGGSPSGSTVWASGNQWESTHFRGQNSTIQDWTGRSNNPGSPPTLALPRLVMGMGRPFEPSIYYVGVYNPSATSETSYTIDSRGIGSSQTYPVTDLAYSGGSAAVSNLNAREARYFKVTIPANTPSWEVFLIPAVGEMMLKIRRGAIPDFSDDNSRSSTASGDFQGEMQKAGPERYVMLPPHNQDIIPAGDYYIAVISEGVNPDVYTVGSGTSSGTLTSVGPLAITNLGAASAAGITQAVSLAGGQNKAYQFTVPAGTASLEVRLDNRVGNPGLNLNLGSRPPYANGYGIEGGTQAPGWVHDDNILTVSNPTPGIFSLLVRAENTANTAIYPDASANLVVRTKPNTPLNFAASQNTNGGTHTDTRQMIDGEYTIYEVQVPPSVDGQPVTGWVIKTDVLQGAVSMEVYKNFADPTSGASVTGGFAVIVPPFLTFGETWYVRVKATGLTNYTLTSRPVTLERPVWQMPTTFNQTFGDSGNDSAGNPLPGDRGTDLGQGEWHFYAVDVPAGNLGLLRTELQAISGNPDLYIREDGVPTTSHDSNGNASGGSTLYQRQLTATATEYGNWVPFDGRTERQLSPGRWFFGVKAAGNSNVRYRLNVSTGQVTDLALNGGSATAQSLADNDWRYYRFTVPADAPVNWALTFSQQVGDVVMWLRDTVPPGQGLYNSSSNVESWSTDSKNQGPYSNVGQDAAGTYTFTTPPLRPGQTYYAGFRSNSSATFSVSSATSGGIIGTLPVLDFYTGTLNTSIPANSSVLYRIPAPPEATRVKWTSTHASTVQLRLEQGSIPFSTGTSQHYYSTAANSVLNNALSTTIWPWQPAQSYYLRIVNNAATAATVVLTLNGKNATTEDEDNDGLLDAWEKQYFNNITSYSGTSDPDNDGSNNTTEFADGTIPNDAASAKYTLTLTASGGTIAKSLDLPKYFKGTVITLTATPSGASSFIGWSGALSGSANPANLTLNANSSVTATFGIPLATSLDTTGLVWTQGGNAPWFGQSTTTRDATDAAQSGTIGHSQESWMETTVAGPGTLTYWWKVSSQSGGDFLEFHLDGVLQAGRISGTVDWVQKTYPLTAGPHTLRWRYLKNANTVTGSDAAWVDQIEWTPSATDPYTTWAAGFFNSTQLANPAISGHDVDYDNDGVPTLLEYLFGGNPTLPSSGLLPTVTKAPGSNNVVFTYKRKTAATGVTQVIEHSANLAPPWTPAVHGQDGVTIATTPVDAQTEQVTVTIPSTSTSRFVRLKASR
ncbi:MAG: hypothetical protein RLZZ398_340 [Verrucomicrobiota bacterium]|jgi:hypothetical protein